MRHLEKDPYATFDPLDSPAYSITLAAWYIRMPRDTLKTWVLGRSYQTRRGESWSPPVIDIADTKTQSLSFWNLVEAWVLRAMRVKHSVPMHRIKDALQIVSEQMGASRPLIHASWKTGGAELFVERDDIYVAVSGSSRQRLLEGVDGCLARIRWNEANMADWLFPFTREFVPSAAATMPEVVGMTPRISFGEPIISRNGVPTSVIIDRFKGGDKPSHLLREYDISREEFDEAMRWELYLAQKMLAA